MRDCAFPGCTRPRRKGPLCSRHKIQQRAGIPLTPLPPVSNGTEPLEQRMEWRTERTDSCWNWTGATNSQGYGQLRFGNKAIYAHRVAWEMNNGPIPDGLVVDHMCHNRRCVNPAHLQIVTQKQNCENLSLRKDTKSGIRGVSWDKRTRKWHASVMHNRVSYSAGSYDSIADAEQAVIALRKKLHTNNLGDRAPK